MVLKATETSRRISRVSLSLFSRRRSSIRVAQAISVPEQGRNLDWNGSRSLVPLKNVQLHYHHQPECFVSQKDISDSWSKSCKEEEEMQIATFILSHASLISSGSSLRSWATFWIQLVHPSLQDESRWAFYNTFCSYISTSITESHPAKRINRWLCDVGQHGPTCWYHAGYHVAMCYHVGTMLLQMKAILSPKNPNRLLWHPTHSLAS